MGVVEALLLGLVQGLTEFLPVSSSGHIELAKALLGVDLEGDLTFTVAVHGATVLSTMVALRGELSRLLGGALRFRWNGETRYVWKIALSMIPVGLVGLFLRDWISGLFGGGLVLVGAMLLVTSGLLLMASLLGGRGDGPARGEGPGYWSVLLMGLGQALAVLPGLSRSGTTIALGLLGGARRAEAARFSFLMVIPPIVGMNALALLGGDGFGGGGVGVVPLLCGVVMAFVSGYAACRFMLRVVGRGRLGWFAGYCAVVGVLALVLSR